MTIPGERVLESLERRKAAAGFTAPQLRALEWLPAEGSKRASNGGVSSALNSLALYHHALVSTAFEPFGPRGSFKRTWWLTEAGIKARAEVFGSAGCGRESGVSRAPKRAGHCAETPAPWERIMRDLTPAQKKVLAAVPSDHESSSNGIKNRCGLGQRTVYDSLRSLERKGLVSRPNHRLFWAKTKGTAS